MQSSSRRPGNIENGGAGRSAIACRLRRITQTVSASETKRVKFLGRPPDRRSTYLLEVAVSCRNGTCAGDGR
ncbi:hypothetical protein BJS_08067 [Bradyrhizobium japonicum SEMIA 5079]|nr:hypothetical protein BJS_08067 [Bradyrhizobium japonicum SEMIA 5079]